MAAHVTGSAHDCPTAQSICVRCHPHPLLQMGDNFLPGGAIHLGHVKCSSLFSSSTLVTHYEYIQADQTAGVMNMVHVGREHCFNRICLL
jgi:hypothetical protein